MCTCRKLDCAVAICVDEKYIDEADWPDSSKRHWKAESDFASVAEKNAYLQKIQDRADGQQVKTFVADHWTFEYDLAYAGLANELIDAIVATLYVEKNREKKKEEILKKYAEQPSPESKAAYLYSFFSIKNASKAEVAQHLSFILEDQYSQDSAALQKKLPQYIRDAIDYVT